MSKAHMGKRRSAESVLKQQKTRRENNFRLSAESIAKRTATRKLNDGYKYSAEARANMSKSHMGKKLTPESIAKREATKKLKREIKTNILKSKLDK